MSKNVDNHRAAHESWNRRDFDNVLRDVNDNIVYSEKSRNTIYKNRQEFRKMVEEWATAFPDGKIVKATYTDAGNTVVAQFTIEGTNNGSFVGMKPTGKKISVAICEVCHFDNNNRMTSSELYYDQLTLLTQLGHLQPIKMAA